MKEKEREKIVESEEPMVTLATWYAIDSGL